LKISELKNYYLGHCDVAGTSQIMGFIPHPVDRDWVEGSNISHDWCSSL